MPAKKAVTKKSGVKRGNFRQVDRIRGLIAQRRFHFLARGCKSRQRSLFIASCACNLPFSPTRTLLTEGKIRPFRRSSGNYPICGVVIAQIESGSESNAPDPVAGTEVHRQLVKKRLRRDRIALGESKPSQCKLSAKIV